MTRIFRTAACLLAAAVVTVNASPAVADDHADDHAGVQRVLDQAVARDGLPGILADVRDSRGTWFGTAGVADTATGRERRQQDRFRVGSITKTFTSTVVLKLAAEGRLSLDDTVDKWLPGVVRGNGHDGSRITVRRLLNGTSGIFAYTLDQTIITNYATPAFMDHRFDVVRPEKLVKIAMTHPPSFAPGTAWGYSNTNYVLAGMIIEKVTGRSYAEEVARRITRPLGMTATYVPGDEAKLRGPHARHYSKLQVTGPDAKVHDTTDMNASWAWAAGDMVSTTGDLHTFYRALLRGRLLPPAQQKEMFTTVSTEGVPWIDNTAYGLGVFSQKLSCGVTAWGNGGFIHGSWTYAMGTRDGKRMLVSNVNGDWADPISIFAKELEAELCPPGSR
ncbi:alkaline D-peptidase [Nonomuraea sp. WAC 01424]|uniref:serine hydrolase domain-containing protein n=1 Tax=Nonomuraea sp. WAC 01424 TaxID=2203200 RepID=UPI000F78550A|nr:serine hydrolase domain-containing protein [Nonomuraea sp. WAC 01424]RSM98140.1 alkaline D-peptidase [Nonomuraea sp. WAC 01424]